MEYTNTEILEALRRGVAHFTYLKSSGNVRDAYGTLNMDCIPPKEHPKGTARKAPENKMITYYDIFSEGWRTFHPEKVTFIDEDYGE